MCVCTSARRSTSYASTVVAWGWKRRSGNPTLASWPTLRRKYRSRRVHVLSWVYRDAKGFPVSHLIRSIMGELALLGAAGEAGIAGPRVAGDDPVGLESPVWRLAA